MKNVTEKYCIIQSLQRQPLAGKAYASFSPTALAQIYGNL